MTPKNAAHSKLSLRGWVGLRAGMAARRASRALGKGAGGMFGGRVALTVNPQMVQELAEGKKTVLITGTNGKSTTTKMTAAALGTLAPVAANLGGDNMLTGVATALMTGRHAPFAVLEVDEMNLPAVAARTNPDVIILLNLSRDQLDRVGEIGVVEKRVREAVEACPDAIIVANCDDPLIVSAAWDAPHVVWVAAGAPWKDDAAAFPRTGTLVIRDGEDWHVQGADYRRPKPQWWISDVEGDGAFRVNGPGGLTQKIHLSLPGRANRGNATQAIAAAVSMGAGLTRSVRAVERIDGVAGRYQTYDVDGRQVNLLLAKNPAGWQESQTAMPAETRQLVIAVNGQDADGNDLSWLWDVDFTPVQELSEVQVLASGERASDLAVRLEYAGIPAKIVESPLEAILTLEEGPVQVLANYTAFRDLLKDIGARAQEPNPAKETHNV